MSYINIKKLILNSPAGNDKESSCYTGSKSCQYNKFGQCITCGGVKGRKRYKQCNITIANNNKRGTSTDVD